MPVHTSLLSDWCFFPKVLPLVLSAHGFARNKSWMHHGRNRVYAIWNHTRQLLLFLVFFQLHPFLSMYLFFLDPKLPPLILGQQKNQEMLLRKVTCRVGVEEDGGPHSLQLTPPVFYQNTKTTSLIYYSTCTSQSWVYQEYLAENKGWEPQLWPWPILTLTSMKLASNKALCHQRACLSRNRGFSRGKYLPDLQGIWDFLLPFTIRH